MDVTLLQLVFPGKTVCSAPALGGGGQLAGRAAPGDHGDSNELKETGCSHRTVIGRVPQISAMDATTRILDALKAGQAGAGEELFTVVYGELRRMAAHKMAGEQPGQTLQPTALVHEAWLRLVGSESSHFDSRGHFFAAAAEAMRRILIERARAKKAQKRGGGVEMLALDEADIAIHANDDTLLVVNEALTKLETEDAQMAELVKLRFFAGMTNEQAGQLLGISERSAKRHWTFARAWLYDEITRHTT